ncbi:hypothetical protein ACFLQU_05960 [Verrucomicrobiota bacterium]
MTLLSSCANEQQSDLTAETQQGKILATVPPSQGIVKVRQKLCPNLRVFWGAGPALGFAEEMKWAEKSIAQLQSGSAQSTR